MPRLWHLMAHTLPPETVEELRKAEAARGCPANPVQHRCPKCNSDAVVGERLSDPVWLQLECCTCGRKWLRNIRDGRWNEVT